MGMAVCRHCGEDRRDDEFYPSTPHKCKACVRGYNNGWRAANPDEVRRLSRDAYRRTRAQRMEGVVRLCEQCGQQLDAQKSTHAKYCSKACHVAAAEDRRKTAVLKAREGRLCERCAEPIPVTRNLKATTCSARCRDALNELRLMHVKCRALSQYAVKVGRLVRQPCEVCGSADVEIHHLDYFEPLNVRWLCFLHHRTLMHGHNIIERSAQR